MQVSETVMSCGTERASSRSACPPRLPVNADMAAWQPSARRRHWALTHSITSSARPSSGTGTVMPSALALLRFRMNSHRSKAAVQHKSRTSAQSPQHPGKRTPRVGPAGSSVPAADPVIRRTLYFNCCADSGFAVRLHRLRMDFESKSRRFPNVRPGIAQTNRNRNWLSPCRIAHTTYHQRALRWWIGIKQQM
jgi:hypothetical protein